MSTAPKPPRFVKFNPELTTGHIIQIIVIITAMFAAYSDLKQDKAVQAKDILALQVKDGEMTARGNERYADLKLEIRELKASVADIKDGLNILRGRAAEPGSRVLSR